MKNIEQDPKLTSHGHFEHTYLFYLTYAQYFLKSGKSHINTWNPGLSFEYIICGNTQCMSLCSRVARVGRGAVAPR